MTEIGTVGALLEWLIDQPADAPVILACDAEGNDHSPLAEAVSARYVPQTSWSGRVLDEDDDTGDQALNAVVFYPTC